MSEKTPLTALTGFNRLTENARTTILAAYKLAENFNNHEVTGLHLFIAMLQSPSALLTKIFAQFRLDSAETLRELEREAITASLSNLVEPKFGDALKNLINDSFLIAEKYAHVYVGTEHLLLALLQTDYQFVQELKLAGLTINKVEEMIGNIGSYWPGILSQPDSYDDEDGDEFKMEGGALPFFCKSMNEQSRKGEFMRITGRDEEIARVLHILARKTKNNPILVGDAGVGKTAVVQGLVQLIESGDVPPSFLNKEVLSLDVASIVAGAKVRGDVEERVLALINETIQDGNKIIFIDEIHMIVGAGSQGRDAMDIGNILKPYLSDPRLRIIGATTVAEFRRYFDDDPALSRRFQPIEIEEIDRESAMSIMESLKPEFEEYHGVKIRKESLQAAVELSSKFIMDRYLPDKAIDLIDEAAASIKIGREIHLEPKLSRLGDKLLKAQQKKSNAILDNNLKKAYAARAEEERITDEIEELMEGGGDTSPKHKIVTPELVQDVVVSWTKIPLAAGLDGQKLRSLAKNIRARIVGQDHVLERVVSALRRSHLGLTESNRPLASLLFLGPTGVGKTELAKTIAAELFGDPDLLIQLNMSEYMEMHSVSKLIGAPPGYVGYQEGGKLTELIRRNPYSVVLFDEIEKAHPEVLNLLLQILEEGSLEDGRGRMAFFRNTVVILTSNIGAEQVAHDRRLGFDVSVKEENQPEMDAAFVEMRDQLLNSLRKEVRPEILNRLDDVLVFRGFNEKDCEEIAKLRVHDFVATLLDKNIALSVPYKVIKLINEQGYSKEFGARNIRRKMQELLEDGLANFMLENDIRPGRKKQTNIAVEVENDKLNFKVTK